MADSLLARDVQLPAVRLTPRQPRRHENVRQARSICGEADGEPYDRSVEERVSRLEKGMQEVKSAIGQLQATTARLEDRLGRVEIGIARDLATKAELAELRTAIVGGFAGKPGKTYVWGILAALLMALACGLAVLAILK
jgi:hypothetical protein